MEKLLIIGKSANCDIILSQDSVSRSHAQLVIRKNAIDIIDLNSTNGTYVNGSRINEPLSLVKGDVVLLGGVLLNWEPYIPATASSETIPNETLLTLASKSKTKNQVIVAITLIAASVVIGVITLNYYEKDSENKSYSEESEAENIIIGDGTNEEELNETFQTDTDKKIEPGEVDYDFSCLSEKDETVTTDVITILGDIEGGLIDMFGEDVSISEEHEMGRDLLTEITVSDFGNDYTRIQKICNRLINAVPNKKGYRYSVHYVNEDVLNAFTAGGQIFVYKGMIDFCKNDNELASIIAHEIAHNELGHIKRKMSEIKTMESIGGELTAELFMAATLSFGQKMETHCDLYGIDLAIKAGYNGCEVVNVWKRMEDSHFNSTESMIRSHPFSEQRADCCQNHIDTYHPNKCKQ